MYCKATLSVSKRLCLKKRHINLLMMVMRIGMMMKMVVVTMTKVIMIVVTVLMTKVTM